MEFGSIEQMGDWDEFAASAKKEMDDPDTIGCVMIVVQKHPDGHQPVMNIGAKPTCDATDLRMLLTAVYEGTPTVIGALVGATEYKQAAEAQSN